MQIKCLDKQHICHSSNRFDAFARINLHVKTSGVPSTALSTFFYYPSTLIYWCTQIHTNISLGLDEDDLHHVENDLQVIAET